MGSHDDRQMPGDRSRLGGDGHSVGRIGSPGPPRTRVCGPHGGSAVGLLAIALVVGLPVTAAADPPLRASSDLDGLHVWLGPVGAATRIEGGWDSAWGGNLAVLRVRERAPLAIAGVWFGAAHYAVRDGGRAWIDGVVGTRRLGARMLGAAAGPVIELGDLHHPRVGAQTSIWCFAGVVPYARAGVLQTSGVFVEVGISLSVPAFRF